MDKSDSKIILKLMFLLFPILFLSCDNETNVTMPNLEGNLLVNDFGVIKELTKEQYRPNMVIRYKKDGYTIAALKLDSFTSSIEKSVPSPKIWIDSTPYYYDRITTMDSGNVKVKIYNSHLRSVNGRLIYNPIRLLKQEIDKKNLNNVLPGDGMIGKVDANVVSFRVDMQEGSHDIHLKKGGYFSVSFRLPGNPFYHPDSLSMWHFDDTNGRWTFETFAHRNGDVYEADLNEFGWWTSFKSDCDFRKITIRLKELLSYPLPYSNLSFISKNTKKSYNISTDAMGVGNFYLDTDDTYEVHMHGFSIASHDHDWPFSESYTNIKSPQENDLVCNIDLGDSIIDLTEKFFISSVCKENGLSYDELRQTSPRQTDKWKISEVVESPYADSTDNSILTTDETITEDETKYKKWISMAPERQYPMTVLMPLIDNTSIGKINYCQTLMSQWDTLQTLYLRENNSYLRLVPYKTHDTILAELSEEISSFSVDTITDGNRELYHINNLCVKFNKKIEIEYSLWSTHKRTSIPNTYKKGYVSFFKEEFGVPSITYKYKFREIDKCTIKQTLQEIRSCKLKIDTKDPIYIRVSELYDKELQILSIKDKYGNNVLLNPEHGIIHPKALLSDELTFEFEDEDDVYNSTIRHTPLDCDSFYNNSTPKNKGSWGFLIIAVLIFGAIYLAKKKKEHRETANFQDTKTYGYREYEKTANQDDGSTRYYTGNSLTPHINLALVIAKVINMGPSFEIRYEELELIREFQVSIGLKDNLVDWVEKCRFMQCDMDKVLPNLMPLPEKKRASLAKLLFKIANLDDGIKNDEWEFIDKVMIDLKISQKHIDALHRQYDPLGKRNSTHELPSDFAILIAKVINMGPSFDMRHKNLIKKFQLSIELEDNLVDKVAKYRNKECNIDQAVSNLTPLPETMKFDLIKLLFEIADTDDGIQNNERDFLNKVMRDLEISQKHANSLYNKYDSLTTERDLSHLYLNLSLLIAKVINMGPSFDIRHQELIWEFQLSFGLEENLVDWIIKNRYRLCDIDKVLSNLTTLSKTKKVSLVKLLFKIAVTDDGIKNDEWDFLNKVMRDLKISKNHIDALHRRYEPLRSERDSSHQSKSEESSRQYKANDSGEKTRNNKRNSSYKAKDEESSRQYKTNDSGKKTGNDKKQKSYSPNAEYFAVLGISDDSTIEEVKAAYRKLAKTWHPDFPKNANNIEECIRKMAEINIAYKEILKDLEK